MAITRARGACQEQGHAHTYVGTDAKLKYDRAELPKTRNSTSHRSFYCNNVTIKTIIKTSSDPPAYLRRFERFRAEPSSAPVVADAVGPDASAAADPDASPGSEVSPTAGPEASTAGPEAPPGPEGGRHAL